MDDIGPKSIQTRVVGIITDEMHPYIQFSSNRVFYENVQRCILSVILSQLLTKQTFTARKTRVYKSSMTYPLGVSKQFPSLKNKPYTSLDTTQEVNYSYICGLHCSLSCSNQFRLNRVCMLTRTNEALLCKTLGTLQQVCKY